MISSRWAGRLLCALLVFAITPIVRTQQPQADQTGIAYLAVDLRSGATLASERAERLDIPVLPGSVMKIAALAAALESGVIGPRSGILCTHEARVAGHQLVCTHPDLRRPLLPAEALAHSCNTFFTTVAARTPRSALDRVLTDLGLPTTDPGVSVQAAAVGLEGIRIAPRRLIAAVAKIAADPNTLPWKPATLAAVRDGLRGAATYGSASALGARGLASWAKTGTVLNNGIAQGLVVGVTPVPQPTTGFVLMTSGGAGLDAAALAAERLAPKAAGSSSVRIGVARRDRGYDVHTIPLDEYVARVVSGESVAGSSPAALEALAITVRTYTEANRGRHAAEGFDLCDLTHCQVMRTAVAAATRAAQATSSTVLLDKGNVANVFYTASCGGYTERPSAVWPGAPDPLYLPSHADAACAGEPTWQSNVAVGALERALAVGRFRGDTLRNVTVTSRTASGRVEWLRLDGLSPDQISGEDFRTLVGRTLGWQYLKSTAFTVRRTGSGFHFDGHGAGHGVGLCVLGSANLAAKGSSATDLLAYYFPGLAIGPLGTGSRAPLDRASSTLASASINIVVPPSERDGVPSIRALTSRTLDALTAAIGVPSPANLMLRFHPTVEDYQRETKQPWFTAASQRDTTIDLLPLEVFRQRGTLETTLKHELVHVLTASALADRPMWVREGLASYYAGEYRDAPLNVCPADAAFRSPSSAGALKRALEDATACAAAQLRAGKTWRDLK